jgi:hypothetical protein
MIRWWLAGLLGVTLASCSSVDRRIYDENDPPRLRDGQIVMYTYWFPGNEQRREERILVCEGGTVTASLQSFDRGRFEGTVPEGIWVNMWKRFLDSPSFKAGTLGVDTDDPGSGSPYHVLRFTLGPVFREFSAQYRRDAVIFSTRNVAERLAYSNEIVDLVAAHAVEQVAPPESPSPDTRQPGPAYRPGPGARAGGEKGGS